MINQSQTYQKPQPYYLLFTYLHLNGDDFARLVTNIQIISKILSDNDDDDADK